MAAQLGVCLKRGTDGTRDALTRHIQREYCLREELGMRATLNIDERALSEATTHAAGQTKTEIGNQALRSSACGKRQKQLLELRGQVDWQGDIDQLRKRG